MVKTNLTDEQLRIAKENDIPYERVHARIVELGWSVDTAITKPVNKYRKHKDMKKWVATAKENGISEKTFKKRLREGYSPERAMTEPLKKKRIVLTDYEKELLSKNNISKPLFMSRLKRGWSRERALKEPIRGDCDYREWGGIRVPEYLIRHGRNIGLSYDVMYWRITQQDYDVVDACTNLKMDGIKPLSYSDEYNGGF